MRNHKKRAFILFAIVLIIGSIAYIAADRFLIRHVEIVDVSAYAEAASETVQSNTAEADPTGTVQAVTTESAAQLPAATSTINTGTFTYDDWSYQSDTVTISIKEYSSGSGNNALTYFVADVLISDATQLQNAFADDQFGTNIIEYTSRIAEDNDAVFAVNGDYYGFRTTGIIIRNGVIYRDEPARTGLAFYPDGSMKVYDETQTTAQELLDEGVWNTLSFGPALIEDSVIASNLGTIEIDTNFGNHSIQGNQPRTGVGIIDENHFVFIVVDGRSKGYSMGMTLEEFAQIFKDLGCTDAYNLDGGGSSTMYFMGRVVNNPLGKNKERGTSDILFIGS